MADKVQFSAEFAAFAADDARERAAQLYREWEKQAARNMVAAMRSHGLLVAWRPCWGVVSAGGKAKITGLTFEAACEYCAMLNGLEDVPARATFRPILISHQVYEREPYPNAAIVNPVSFSV